MGGILTCQFGKFICDDVLPISHFPRNLEDPSPFILVALYKGLPSCTEIQAFQLKEKALLRTLRVAIPVLQLAHLVPRNVVLISVSTDTSIWGISRRGNGLFCSIT